MSEINRAEALRRRNDEEALRRATSSDPAEPGHLPQGGRLDGEGLIGKKELDKARETLNRYKAGKAVLDARIVDNERWWRMQHLPEVTRDIRRPGDTPSGWLFNSIANKHADAMDNYPMPSVLPREASDRADAEALSSVLPVILEQNHFEDVYDDAWRYKLKSGTTVYGVFWNNRKLGGLGDVEIRRVDVLNLFWEPRINDLQESKNLFFVYSIDNDTLHAMYPQLKEKKPGRDFLVTEYAYDDTDPEQDKSTVIDWYYKKYEGGRTVLHYCKFVGDIVLFASENEPDWRERGIYDHGQYPFVMDPMFRMEGSPAGFGYIDVMKGVQTRIDRIQNAITENSLEVISNRYFIRDAASINEDEFKDHSNKLVHVAGAVTDENIKHIDVPDINGNYIEILNNYITELKEISGNRDVSNGGSTAGVTAASAIAAMQEAGSKLSRDMIKASYRVFARICNLVLENVRQFYTEQREFRITGVDGKESFISFSNAHIAPTVRPGAFGMQESRMPVFDIIVKAQKASPYTKISQNELAKEFYNMGFFDPANADRALACLNIMDFEGKAELTQSIQKNGTLFEKFTQLQQMALQMAQTIDQQNGSTLTNDLVAMGLLGEEAVQQTGVTGASVAKVKTDALGGIQGENSIVERAKTQTAEATAPR